MGHFWLRIQEIFQILWKFMILFYISFKPFEKILKRKEMLACQSWCVFYGTPGITLILIFENPNINLYFPFRATLSSSLHAWYIGLQYSTPWRHRTSEIFYPPRNVSSKYWYPYHRYNFCPLFPPFSSVESRICGERGLVLQRLWWKIWSLWGILRQKEFLLQKGTSRLCGWVEKCYSRWCWK